ncbi:MFS transporter [Paraburkholderia panacisoli]|uniref:MFS transporter n=1 Tax=Paraburkholderia panacisoli TaxID=2603818 RepID=A0A5B0G3I2_9BURK|nr:MFS transporter [Paraburkholderia panacisoli]KAA0998053.1 MFS transporter [Paraburkholderia panacisoli]
MSNAANRAVVAAPDQRRRLRRVVTAATIGTALEWFDLVVYGFFAVVIAKLFFPTESELTSLLLALSTFGGSYLMRPLGALLLGSYSDRVGRKRGLTLSIALMAIGTLMIAATPSYASIGLAAPVIVVAGRLIQGISAGGEFGASTSFLVEHSPRSQRGFYASFQMAAQGGTAVIASLFGTLLTRYLTPEQLLGWGWRVPFIFGLLIIPVAYFIRRHVDETPVFIKDAHAGSPIRETFTDNKMRLVLAIGIYVLVTASSYVIILYMPTFAIKQLRLDPSLAFAGTLLMGGVQMIACPIAGAIADRGGRKRVLLFAAVTLGLVVLPLFAWLIASPSPAVFIAICAILGVIVSGYQGPMPAVLSELFPSRVRTTGLALTHNLAVAIFGGFAPLVLTWGMSVTQSKFVPAAYVTAAAIISVIGLLICICKFGDDKPTE